MKSLNRLTLILAGTLLWSTAAPAETVEERLQRMEQRIRELEQEVRSLHAAKPPTPSLPATTASAEKAPATAPILLADQKGFGFKSADGNFAIRLGGQVKVDGGFLLRDDAKSYADSFSINSARPVITGTIFKEFDFALSGEFTGTPSLTDAYIEWTHWPALKLRAGRFKQPFGLERLQSDPWNAFTTLGLPSQLVPARDVAVQVAGELFEGVFGYAASIGNGMPDGSSVSADTTDAKELTGRVWVQPFKKTRVELLQGLGVGVAATYGLQGGATNAANLASYKSASGSTFFSYVTGSTNGTFATDERIRVSPQLSYYYGRLGLLGEYVLSAQEVTRQGRKEQLLTTAWQVVGSLALTDDAPAYKGITPKRPFSLKDGQWGAWELVARVGQLHADNEAFYGSSTTRFADPAKSASQATAWGVGLNWYLNRNLRWTLDFDHTDFEGGATTGDRPAEDFLSTRFQVVF
jgi:phosphate-selective porin OprO/OprP